MLNMFRPSAALMVTSIAFIIPFISHAQTVSCATPRHYQYTLTPSQAKLLACGDGSDTIVMNISPGGSGGWATPNDTGWTLARATITYHNAV